MRVGPARAVVALLALAVVTVVPTAGGLSSVGTGVGVVLVALAAGLAAAGAPRHAVLLGLTGTALVLASLAPLGDGAPPARWAALAALPTVVPLAGLLVVQQRWSAGLLAAGALVAGPVRTLVYDPFLDPECLGCRAVPTVAALSPRVAAGLALAGGVFVVVGLVLDLRRGTHRWAVAGLAAMQVWSLTAWSQVRGAVPEAGEIAALLAGALAGVVLVRTLVVRIRIQRLSAALESGTAPQASLARTLGDRTLSLDFAAAPDEWVDAAGAPAPGPDAEQVTTPVRVGGEVVARVHHAPDSGRADSLAASLTPELRLAIEQARLGARLEAQVRQLQESRARVVEAGDEARRRLERDLHDGAQQELLALGFDVKRAAAATPQDARLARCVGEVAGALDDLRTLASGVHPALLTAAGLGPALEQTGSRCAYTVRVSALPDQRFAPAIERTAYLLVVDTAGRGPVEVEASVVGASLRLTLTGPALPSDSVVPERVAALGGTLVESPGRTEVTMPCA